MNWTNTFLNLDTKLIFLFKEVVSLWVLRNISLLNIFWLMELTPYISIITPPASIILEAEKNIHKWH